MSIQQNKKKEEKTAQREASGIPANGNVNKPEAGPGPGSTWEAQPALRSRPNTGQRIESNRNSINDQ